MVDKELIEIWRNMLKPSVSLWLLNTNYEEMGEQDKEEFERDFDEILDLALIGLKHKAQLSLEDATSSTSSTDDTIGRQFEEIVVRYPSVDLRNYTEYKGKPYFSIRYKENDEDYIGYGTYNPEVLSRYLRDYFMPPAQPEQRWIPCSERLPEERDWYLGIFKEPDTGWINLLPFICDYLLGKKTKATTKEGWILRGFTDREEHIDYYFNLECVAWMPLPEPYKKGDADGK